MAACLLIAAAIALILYRGNPAQWLVYLTPLENGAESKQALRQEQERAFLELDQALKAERSKVEKLTGQLAEAQREGATQAALTRKTIDDGARRGADRERVIGELRQELKQREGNTDAQPNVRAAEQQALNQERDKTERLRIELAAALREGQSQAAIARSASDEITRLKAGSARAAEELRRAEDKADKLAGELAAARQEIEAQTAVARAAGDEAQRALESRKRNADEQGQALREAQAKAEKLTTELKEAAEHGAEERRALQAERDRTEKLAEAKSKLETQAKARDNQLAAMREELQQARADATLARDSLEAERTRSTPASTLPMADRAPAAPSPPPPAPIKDLAGERQPTTAAKQSTTASKQDNQQIVHLMARANQLLEQGNVGAARNMLDRAAEMGSAEALFGLAETYDPSVLSARQTFGTQSDVSKARELYSKALVGGIGEAKARLEALQQ